LTDKLSQKVTGLKAVSLRLEALIDLGLALAAERDPRHLLGNVCSAARRIIGAKYAVVGALDNTGQALRHFCTSGMNAETVVQLSPPMAQQGLLGVLLTEQRTYRRCDLQGDPQAVGLPPEHPPVHTFLGVPILTATQVYGCLCLTDKFGAEEFSAADERLAVSLAAQVAVAYENARRYYASPVPAE
jgi:GAF domain-containing protein